MWQMVPQFSRLLKMCTCYYRFLNYQLQRVHKEVSHDKYGNGVVIVKLKSTSIFGNLRPLSCSFLWGWIFVFTLWGPAPSRDTWAVDYIAVFLVDKNFIINCFLLVHEIVSLSIRNNSNLIKLHEEGSRRS